jgi:GxxExxY protein
MLLVPRMPGHARRVNGNCSPEKARMSRIDPNRSRPRPRIIEEQLSFLIVAAFYEVYNALGYGFLESIYCRAIEIALRKRGLRVEREYPITVYFDGHEVGKHRADFLIEGRVVLELKSTEYITDVPKRQIHNYLAATGCELGIVLHFGPKPVFHRVLNARLHNVR